MRAASGVSTLPPSTADPVVAAASQVIGGPVGRYAAWVPRTLEANLRSAWQPVAALLMATSSIFLAGGVLQKAHCVRVGWNTPDQFWHACYSDLPVVYRSSGMLDGAMPLLESAGRAPVDQPVLASLSLWLVGLVTPDGSAASRLQWYFGIWAAVLTVVLALVVLLTVRSAPRGRWTAAHVAASPVLVTVALVSVDLLAVLLTAAGMWLWGRSRVVPAGVLLGLAVATRSYPLVVLAAIGLLCVRTSRLDEWRRMAVAAAATFAAVFVPAYLAWPHAATAPYTAWWGSGASYGSPWMLPQLLALAPEWMLPGLIGHPLPTGLVTALAVLGWVFALASGAALALGSARRPTVAEVSMVMLVVVMLTSKALPVQAALWLLPLLALTRTWWRDHLIWAGVEIAAFVAVWLYIASFTTADRGLPAHVYAMFMLARLGAMGYLAVRVWSAARARPALWPDDDADDLPDDDVAARPEGEAGSEGQLATDEIDELAGPMAGQDDALVVRLG